MTTRTDQVLDLYFKHRLTGQQKYYRDRTEEYERAHGQALALRNTLFILSAVGAGVSQVTTGTWRGTLGVAAAVLGALAGAVTAYESLIGYPSLTKIYHDTWAGLQAARIDWDEPDADTEKSIRRVEQIFRTENGQWGQLVVRQSEHVSPDGAPTQPAGSHDK
jgi:hypothetical protein